MNCSALRPVSSLLPCLALAVTVAVTAAMPAHAASVTEPPKGLSAPPQATPMPVFELTGFDGSKVRSTDLRDKVTVIRFWATW
jgi:cytochrome oxidase Cu insertion factor (SCO1/SenC/PrrC family)